MLYFEAFFIFSRERLSSASLTIFHGSGKPKSITSVLHWWVLINLVTNTIRILELNLVSFSLFSSYVLTYNRISILNGNGKKLGCSSRGLQFPPFSSSCHLELLYWMLILFMANHILLCIGKTFSFSYIQVSF